MPRLGQMQRKPKQKRQKRIDGFGLGCRWSVELASGKTQRKTNLHYITKNGGILAGRSAGCAVVYLAGLIGRVGACMSFLVSDILLYIDLKQITLRGCVFIWVQCVILSGSIVQIYQRDKNSGLYNRGWVSAGACRQISAAARAVYA